MRDELLDIILQNLLWKQHCGGLSQAEYKLYVSMINLVEGLSQNELKRLAENAVGLTAIEKSEEQFQNTETAVKSKLAQWILQKRPTIQKQK